MFLNSVTATGGSAADEDKLVKAGVEAALKPFADLLEKLAGPAAQEIGLTLKDHVRVFRLRRQLRLFERVKEMLRQAGMEPGRVPFKLLQPIVEGASLEEQDKLQDKWAALLTNASTGHNVHPSFPEILKQLNENDVLYLDALYEYQHDREKADKSKFPLPSGRKHSYDELENRFLRRIAELLKVRYDDSDDARRTLERRLVYSGYADNAIRLGLISAAVRPGMTPKLTRFGLQFVRACKPPA